MAPALLASLMLVAPSAHAADPSAGRLLRDLRGLQTVGSVLYVAAHPDDENTRLLSWSVGDRQLRTAYLSMTRGGGGQNLIGSEQAELLGVVRTGELLAARHIDGAEQWFTRMRDFGYSKSADETLDFWGHEAALDDVVRAIRGFRPDVVVTRFPTEGTTHGHHLASAILAGEAFTAAADPAYVTEGLPPWRAVRLVHNRSSWSFDEDTDTSVFPSVDVGTYDPLTGQSYGEVAAASRTMHKSQGFGASPRVGPQPEYFTAVDGAPLSVGEDLFAGIDMTWGRFGDTRGLQKALTKAADRFNPAAPHEILGRLADLHPQIGAVGDPGWRDHKLADLEALMVDCAGLWLTARSDRRAATPTEDLAITVTALMRNDADVQLHRVRIGDHAMEAGPLQVHQPFAEDVTISVPADTALSTPHWLVQPATAPRYAVDDPSLRNLADTPPSLMAWFDLTIAGQAITVGRPVVHAWTDPVAGERAHPVEVLPAVTATFSQGSTLVPTDGTARIQLSIRSDTGPRSGVVSLHGTDGLTVTPTEVPYTLDDANPEVVASLAVAVSADAVAGHVEARIDGEPLQQRAIVDHPHLPRRSVLSAARLKVVPVSLDRGETSRIGYVVGSGDAVPEALKAVGYQVEEVDPSTLGASDAERFDAVVLGIRAYNTRPELVALHPGLMDYVARGGRLIAQYNTSNRWRILDGPIGPLPFAIDRGRVTDETAEMVAVDPAHPLLHHPNPLGPADFEGWVQERGLYFAKTWDPGYTPIFSVHDPGEDPLLGSLIVTPHGEGVFVYTGLSFFRQLPAGVPGATRLFANLLAL